MREALHLHLRLLFVTLSILASAIALIPAEARFTDDYVYPVVSEVLVADHSVFTMVSSADCTPGPSGSCEPLLVSPSPSPQLLAPQPACPQRYDLQPVQWFNDQALTGREAASGCSRAAGLSVLVRDEIETWVGDDVQVIHRSPCGGSVLVTPHGAPDPRYALGSLRYVESYRFADPNDFVWIVDKFLQGVAPTHESPVWAVHLKAFSPSGLTSGGDDEGDSCEPLSDSAMHMPWGYGYDPVNPDNEEVSYNAQLLILLIDLPAGDPREHGDGSFNEDDPSVCNVPYCAGDEGNSHAFNPFTTARGPRHDHALAYVRVHFSEQAHVVPEPRRFVINDLTGSASCFHSHDGSGPVFPCMEE